ncbi:hypothetical protein PROFUN_11179 [Planoprotostelium fungivorum]|uniref:MD-2-related lipid-recognition domain-containing protein n=1 Tax=Planoprotostelium fungivorum TaxID=1890364 RepID=A0A2P6NAP5_9EUKA|nr:hypothetical protein PROFUN_11179 [Planoprotostelium fungivorum]
MTQLLRRHNNILSRREHNNCFGSFRERKSKGFILTFSTNNQPSNMQRIALFTLLVAALAVAEFSICAGPDDLVKIGSLTFTPDPPVAGQSLTISGAGTLASDVTNGTINLYVEVDELPLLNVTVPLCDVLAKTELPCPVAAGTHTLTLKVTIPGTTPSGDYVANVRVFNQDNAELTCVNGKVTL